jgi:hypothetical protein
MKSKKSDVQSKLVVYADESFAMKAGETIYEIKKAPGSGPSFIVSASVYGVRILDEAQEKVALAALLRERLEKSRPDLGLVIAQHSLTAAAPPAFAEFLLTAFANSAHAEAALGDLTERFQLDCIEFGESRARRLYVARALRSSWPLLVRAIGRVAKWGAIISTVKRLLG